MTYTIDNFPAIPNVENQKKLLKGELSSISEYTFEFTSTPSCDQGTIYTRSSLTPVIEKKMSGKNLAETTIDNLLQVLLDKCEGVEDTVYIVLPTEESPCLSITENMLRAELSYYIG